MLLTKGYEDHSDDFLFWNLRERGRNNLMGLPQSRELKGRHLSEAERERKYRRAAT
jgi:hypothetical protein